MPTKDGIEIRSTLPTLKQDVNWMLTGQWETTVQNMTYIQRHLEDLRPFASDTSDTAEKLQQIISEIEQAKQVGVDDPSLKDFLQRAITGIDEVIQS